MSLSTRLSSFGGKFSTLYTSGHVFSASFMMSPASYSLAMKTTDCMKTPGVLGKALAWTSRKPSTGSATRSIENGFADMAILTDGEGIYFSDCGIDPVSYYCAKFCFHNKCKLKEPL